MTMDECKELAERAIALIGVQLCSEAAATDYLATLLKQTYCAGRVAGIEDCQTIMKGPR